jgi:hypothetical protein
VADSGNRADAAAGEAGNRGRALYADYLRTGDTALIEAAVTAFREAADAVPAGEPGRPLCLSDLGNALRDRSERTGDPADLDEAIAVGREAVETCPAGDPDRPGMLSNLGIALRARFNRAGQSEDVDDAIAIGRQAVDACPPDHAHWPMYLSNLAIALRARFMRAGGLADLDEAVAIGRQAVDATPGDSPDWPMRVSNLAVALQTRFWRTGQLADLDEGIVLGRQAVDRTRVGDPSRPMYLSNLGNSLRQRFARTGQLADLDDGIALGRRAVDAAPAGHPSGPMYASNLANSLRVRYERTGEAADLDEATALGRDLVAATPAEDPNRPWRLSNLAAALRERYRRDGERGDLDEAVALLSEAVDLIPADHPSRPMYVSNLGAALRARSLRTGQLADLDQAITRLSEAVAIIQAGHPHRPMYLSYLGLALYGRFGRAGQLADLDQAISRLSEAVDATPADHSHRPLHLSNLGIMLRARSERGGEPGDLDQAVDRHAAAVSATPAGHRDRPMYLSNLAEALRIRFGRTGQPADLDRAVAAVRESVDTTPAGHRSRSMHLSNLGEALRARFERTGDLEDLDQAVEWLSAAASGTSADDPDVAVYLSRLGNALRVRFGRTGQRADLDRAIRAFREGAGVLTAPPEDRLLAARGWGLCAMLARDPETAVAGYSAAIELLSAAAWHGLDQPTREHHLRTWGGLASDAAAAAIAADQGARAVELLEAGRSMLWRQALSLRQDLDALRKDAPGLAAALDAARAVLNTPAGPGTPAGLADDPDTAGGADYLRATEQRTLADKRQAARDWDAALEQARLIKGLGGFMRPAPYADLRAAAAEGAVVIVNISRHGSHALIVRPATGWDPNPEVLIVGLPGAAIDTVTRQADALLSAQRGPVGPAADDSGPEEDGDQDAVFDVLAWSWHAIAEPILAALRHTSASGGTIRDWPRVWWCPTGPATVLPLHAAGRHPRTESQRDAAGEEAAAADTVAGRVVSSYTPTLTALIQARARPAPDRVRQLAVGVPEAPGASPLDAVRAELRAVARYLPAPEYATRLLDAAATRQAVLEQLPSHSWLHMSSHGLQHPDDPSLSAFLLYDRPLTLADLAALSLREADLAYLAACQTAAGDRGLPDEALHLAGALQLVGYRHVLATLWSISDLAAPAMARNTYANLRHPDPYHPQVADQPDASRAPYALHNAVARLRQSHVAQPLLWAPYIHLGP